MGVDEFERWRSHLLAVAYRLTGTFADAEDAVQDAWLRWHGMGGDGRDGITNPGAWLTTVVSRIGLDRLKSAAHRRETYVGEWLPEPVVTSLDGSDPLAAVVSAEDARFAAMVVLERLTPDQRVAFVLHDGFAVPFSEIAGVLGTTAAAARQLASRARRTVVDAAPPARDPSHAETVSKLLAAMATGDVGAVVALLHPDVTFTGDSNRMAPTAARVIHGSEKVARFVMSLVARYGPAMFEVGRPALVNGDLGMYNERAHTDGEWTELQPHIQALTVRDGLVTAIWDVANPEKFSASPLAAHRPATAPGRRRPR
ncbi:sigma-70 family RNA polymerase sigma factor [Mycolicibacterium sediminis]|uniref:RNA polymerase sigma factor SigJ n=1 Tax=Mycolicibacterium sediminis TaxID=1286180 RepID=A0A7I7QQ56_9MYCO|nr:sigma-70 family RNA polymerase sigma factor [Mycolicibacterium sediminis]BBY28513.1 RNA polymerase sigma factor SigJ [Mycolicibacterium sediminis]